MKRYFLSILLLWSISNILFAQLLSSDSIELERLYMEALKANELGDFNLINSKMDSFIHICESKEDWFYAYGVGMAVKINFASENNQLNVYYNTTKELQRKLLLYEKELGKNGEKAKIDTSIRLGLYYARRGSYNRAQEIFEELLYQLEKENNHYKQLPTLFMHLSNVHKKQGNYSLALNYVLACKKSFLEAEQTFFQAGYINLIDKHTADIYTSMGEKELAELFYFKAIDFSDNMVISSRNIRNRIINNYNAFASFLITENKLDQAITLLKKSLSYHQGNDPKKEETYRTLGKAYAKNKTFDLALNYFQHSIASNNYDSKNYQLAQTYDAMATMLANQNKDKRALEYYQKALINIQDDFEESDFCENPSDFANIFAKKELVKILHNKALVLFRLSKQESDLLSCAWATIKVVLELIDNIRINNTLDNEKQYFLEEIYTIYEDAINISLAQTGVNGVRYAFEVAEKSKAVLLQSAVRNTQIRDYFIPDSLIDLEQQLRFELQSNQEQQYKAKKKNVSTDFLEIEKLNLQKEIGELISLFKKKYPKYFELRYNKEVVSLQSIKHELASDKVLVEYFISQRKVYIFLVQKEQPIQVFPIEIATNELNKLVQDFLPAIYIPYINSDEEEMTQLKSLYSKEYADRVYATNAHYLYELLLKPILNSLSSEQHKLIIISDGILNYLPFDALIQQKIKPEMIGFYENSKDYHYVARDFQISYCYSGTLMDLMNNSTNQVEHQKNKFLVFHDDDFTNQSESIVAVFRRFNFFQSFVNVLNEKGNKESLKEQSDKYKYLHFSVHGVINNERPEQSYLKLRPTSNGDSLLYLRDIYSMAFPTDMVFTSACNAGVGPISKGEGLLSLARGFAYSGAKSLITTLWTVKGGASNQLLTEFYKSIRNGTTKDEALFLAKKVNLKTAAYAHPYYWAGFIPIGNMEAIEMPLPIWNLVGGISLVLVGLFIFMRLKRVN